MNTALLRSADRWRKVESLAALVVVRPARKGQRRRIDRRDE